MDIAKRLKVPNKDVKLLEFMEMLNQTIKQEQEMQRVDLHRWAHVFAHPDLGIRN